jgi:conjugative transfer signal peptidase TraF
VRREVWCVCCLLAFLAICSLPVLRLNLTSSMPIGIYVISREVPARGSIVLVCLPLQIAELARERGYIVQGGSCPGGVVPVGKPVLAVPGDTVVATSSGLLLNGKVVPNSAPLLLDRRGRPLPHLDAGQYVVGPEQLWLISGHSRFSFDSRYFGGVSRSQIRVHVRPLWTSHSPF